MFRVLKQSIAKRSFDDIYNAGATTVLGVGTAGGYAYGAYAARETNPRLNALGDTVVVGTGCAMASAFVALTWPVSVPALAYVAVTH
jgi:hypothetical protein